MTSDHVQPQAGVREAGPGEDGDTAAIYYGEWGVNLINPDEELMDDYNANRLSPLRGNLPTSDEREKSKSLLRPHLAVMLLARFLNERAIV